MAKGAHKPSAPVIHRNRPTRREIRATHCSPLRIPRHDKEEDVLDVRHSQEVEVGPWIVDG